MQRLIVLIIMCAVYSVLVAEPLVYKAADGGYLPVLAESWRARTGGVFVKLREGIDANAVRERLAEKFPDLVTESRPGAIYFVSSDLETLLALLAGVDLKISKGADPFPQLKKSKNIPDRAKLISDTAAKNIAAREEYSEAEVRSVQLDPAGTAAAEFFITRAAQKGDGAKLKGIFKAKISFVMKEGSADPEDDENIRKSAILIVRQGSKVLIRIEKGEEGALGISAVELAGY